jgi:hypothetical protein
MLIAGNFTTYSRFTESWQYACCGKFHYLIQVRGLAAEFWLREISLPNPSSLSHGSMLVAGNFTTYSIFTETRLVAGNFTTKSKCNFGTAIRSFTWCGGNATTTILIDKVMGYNTYLIVKIVIYTTK